MKRKWIYIALPVMLAAALVAGLLLGVYIGNYGRKTSVRPSIGNPKDKLSYTLALINKLYVDPVDMDSLKEQLIPHLIAELDPHSVYMPASEATKANETLDGEFDGIGVVFNMSTDTIVVLNVIPSGPSDKAGVRAGDRIIKINDSIVAGQEIPQNDIVKRLRGKRGTKVNLSLQRKGIKDLVPVTVERGIIPIKSVDAAFIIEPGVGFVKLLAFAKNTYPDMMSALIRLREEGMTRLILDLRGNSGGFLDQAILIANEFLPDDDIIVYTLGRGGVRADQLSEGGRYTDVPLAILIDEGSASSSEILAGAIQDNDRGVLVGRRSFGKGLVQQQIHYPDHSALRLTIARYYTPTGRSIQKPYVNGDGESYGRELNDRYEHSELFTADSIKFADSLRFVTPGGRTVYGGGGIMPDVFMPMDTTDITHYFVEVSGRNILYKYTLDYCDRHRTRLDKVSTIPELKALLDGDKALFDNFIAYASSQGVAYNRAQVEKSRALMTAYIRSYIGRNTPLEDAGFYSMIYPVDKVVVKAIEEVKAISGGSVVPEKN